MRLRDLAMSLDNARQYIVLRSSYLIHWLNCNNLGNSSLLMLRHSTEQNCELNFSLQIVANVTVKFPSLLIRFLIILWLDFAESNVFFAANVAISL